MLTVAISPTTALAGNKIEIEAVNKYDSAHGCSDLVNNITNVDSFRSRMLMGTGIAPFAAGIRYTDSLVYTTDFTDASKTTPGYDYSNFDRGGATQISAISYYSGHGTCNDQTTPPVTCTTASTCPVISGLSASCLRRFDSSTSPSASPPTGACSYSRPRQLIVAPSGTCQGVNYSSGPVAFGESTIRTWGGVGTDGGVNFAVLDVSCGLTPGFEGLGLSAVWAGVSTIGTMLPTRNGDDTADSADRGKAWADRYITSDLSSVSLMWADALNSTTGGSSCAFGGGNHGFVGCGAAISASADSTSAGALFANHTENWQQIVNDGNDAHGTGWFYYSYQCNYDCNNHPWLL